jgi:hypothetical protein
LQVLIKRQGKQVRWAAMRILGAAAGGGAGTGGTYMNDAGEVVVVES